MKLRAEFATFVAGLRIRIHLIRIRIQHLCWKPGVLITKNWTKITAEFFLFILYNTTIYLSLGLHKERQIYKRSLQNMNFLYFFYFCGSFLLSGSGSRFRIRIRIHWPYWIRIQFGSGSATLLSSTFLVCFYFVIRVFSLAPHSGTLSLLYFYGKIGDPDES